MPSERFKRLPEEKQKKIRDACMAEYTRTTIEKASLNRMIEDAGISRGSFYTYFDSKWDVLGYLCESFINEFYECGVRCLEEAQGDIWEMLGQFLNGSLALCRDERRADFIRNIMECSSREALTFDIFSSDPDSPRAVRGRKLERAAYESCVGKSLRKLGWEEYMSFFRMAMMAIAMEIKSFHDGAMTMPAYAAKTPGIGSDALIGDDATGPVLTGGNTEVEEETSPYTKEQLEDGTLEYGEIAWRIEGYNSTYLNLRSQLYSQTTSQSAGTALAAEASALMEDAMDLKSDDMDAETRELFEGYKAAARELRKQGAKLTNKELSGTYARTLRQTKNKLVKAVQQANSSAQQAENGALQLKQNILMLLGFDADAPVTFADVPVPDATRLATMDLAADAQAAVSENYDLMSVRAAKAEGSSNRTVKKRNVAYTEDSVTITVQNLYAAVVSKKQAYDSATAGYQAAAQSYEAAKRQNALGMLSRANYLGLECSWLSSVASYKSAELEYTKAVENYEWAVKGLIVTN